MQTLTINTKDYILGLGGCCTNSHSQALTMICFAVEFHLHQNMCCSCSEVTPLHPYSK